MGRVVRMVPADWQHPRDEEGRYRPLLGGAWSVEHADWLEARTQWENGFREKYFGEGERWVAKDADHTGTYTEYSGGIPNPDDYMPEWSDAERTHLMMYEDTSEGTPISPAFETPGELARWLADNNASAFGSSGASYEQWLATVKAGWAPSAVATGGRLESGVAFMSRDSDASLAEDREAG